MANFSALFASPRSLFKLVSIRSFDYIMSAALLQVNFSKMVTVRHEMKVKTLEGETLAFDAVATNTVEELKAMLFESKHCEDWIERRLLRVKVLVDGLLLDDDQTLEPAGLLCAETDVTVIYTRREVEAATREDIHEEEGLLRVIVPSHVAELVTGAFQGYNQVLTVTIPESVTTIGRSAFEGREDLESITLPESLTIIEPYAFAYCTRLKSVTLPKSITSIETVPLQTASI